MKVLVATSKPFAKVAVDGIREVIEGAGFELPCLRNIQRRQLFLRLLPMLTLSLSAAIS